MFFPPGSSAPVFSAQAEINQRQVSLDSTGGGLLLIFAGYQSVDQTRSLIETVRTHYPSPQQILIASIADLQIVPNLLRGMARGLIKKGYDEAAGRIPAGHDPADHILIIADWEGDLFNKFRAPDVSQQPALLYIDEEKKIAGHYQGGQPVQAALDLIKGSIQ